MPKTYHFGGLREGAIGVKAFIAIPAYGDLCAEFVHSLFGSQVALQSAGISADLCILSGSCHVDDARNDLARQFLDSDCDRMVFIDADIGWDPVDLVRIIQADHDVSGGIYPLKQDYEGYPVRPCQGPLQAEADGWLEVEGVPGGFTCVKRHVIQTLYDQEWRGFYGSRDDPDKHKPIKLIFERLYDNPGEDPIYGARTSSDYAFCRKTRAAGFHIYIHPMIKLRHIGEYTWEGSVGEYWRKANNLTIPDCIRQIREGVETDRTYDELIDAWGNYPWSVASDLAATCVLLGREVDGPILETGSGITTLLFAATGKEVYALEHDPYWGFKTQQALDELGLDNAHIIQAPLIDGWYDERRLPDDEFSLILCDGPPRKLVGALGRYTLFDKIATTRDAIFIMDDADISVPLDKIGRKLNCTFHVFKGRKPYAVARRNHALLSQAS